jgi:hypothetical protein
VAVKEQSGLNRGRRVSGFESVRNEKRFPLREMRVVREEERVKRVLPVAPAIDEEEEEAFALWFGLGFWS